MFTYTTPTITIKLTNVEFSYVDYVRIAIKGDKSIVVREVPVADIDTSTGVTSIKLTQEETAALGAGLLVIQGRAHYTDGTVEATNKFNMHLQNIIDEVIME